MVMASPGVIMPTIRSPGTAPPFGANRTGRSLLIPRMGIGPSVSTFGIVAAVLGHTEHDALVLRMPNHPLSCFWRRCSNSAVFLCSPGTSHARRPRLSSPDALLPKIRRQATSGRDAATRRSDVHHEYCARRAGIAARPIDGQDLEYCVRTATRVARRMLREPCR